MPGTHMKGHIHWAAQHAVNIHRQSIEYIDISKATNRSVILKSVSPFQCIWRGCLLVAPFTATFDK